MLSTKTTLYTRRTPLQRGFAKPMKRLIPVANHRRSLHTSKLVQAQLTPSSYHKTSTWHPNATRKYLEELDARSKLPHPHFEPRSFSDKFASFWAQKLLRTLTDMYFKDNLVKRAMMLETVAAVPGMVAGMTHHLRSLRTLQHDNWIKTLLDEAENERMHLWAFMAIEKPTWSERILIAVTQALFWNVYFLFYVFAPKTAHRFTGYLEEEAVKTYTHFLEMIDDGRIKNIPAPEIAKHYWGLPDDATLRDMVLVIKADEEDHRDVNHSMSNYIYRLKKKSIEYNDINIDKDDIYWHKKGGSPSTPTSQ